MSVCPVTRGFTPPPPSFPAQCPRLHLFLFSFPLSSSSLSSFPSSFPLSAFPLSLPVFYSYLTPFNSAQPSSTYTPFYSYILHYSIHTHTPASTPNHLFIFTFSYSLIVAFVHHATSSLQPQGLSYRYGHRLWHHFLVRNSPALFFFYPFH
jgi:hypothetical protein